MWPTLTGLPDGNGIVYSAPVGNQQTVPITVTMRPRGTGTLLEVRAFAWTGNYRKIGEILTQCA